MMVATLAFATVCSNNSARSYQKLDPGSGSGSPALVATSRKFVNTVFGNCKQELVAELWIWIHWSRIRIRIRIQHFKWIPDPAIRIQGFDDQKLKKEKYRYRTEFFKAFFDYKWQVTYVQAQEKPSALKREHPELQTMKVINFFCVCGSFLPSWIRIRIQEPHWIRIPGYRYGSGSTALVSRYPYVIKCIFLGDFTVVGTFQQ